jgi:hypothetical protein
MDANQRRFAAIHGSALRPFQRAMLNRDGFFSRFASFDAENSKSAKAGGQLRLRDHASFAPLPGFFMRLHGTLDYSRLAGIARLHPCRPAPANRLTTSRATDARSLYIAACFG